MDTCQRFSLANPTQAGPYTKAQRALYTDNRRSFRTLNWATLKNSNRNDLSGHDDMPCLYCFLITIPGFPLSHPARTKGSKIAQPLTNVWSGFEKRRKHLEVAEREAEPKVNEAAGMGVAQQAGGLLSCDCQPLLPHSPWWDRHGFCIEDTGHKVYTHRRMQTQTYINAQQHLGQLWTLLPSRQLRHQDWPRGKQKLLEIYWNQQGEGLGCSIWTPCLGLHLKKRGGLLLVVQLDKLLSFFFFNIYFWLHWVFVAVRAFSSCGERGYSLVVARRLR